MKRDLDLARKLMACFEAMPAGQLANQLAPAEEMDMTAVVEHIRLLIEEGFLEGSATPIPGHGEGGMFCVRTITWKGHDFISATRDETIWEKTKSRLKQVGSYTFEIALEVAKDELKRQLGLAWGG